MNYLTSLKSDKYRNNIETELGHNHSNDILKVIMQFSTKGTTLRQKFSVLNTLTLLGVYPIEIHKCKNISISSSACYLPDTGASTSYVM